MFTFSRGGVLFIALIALYCSYAIKGQMWSTNNEQIYKRIRSQFISYIYQKQHKLM